MTPNEAAGTAALPCKPNDVMAPYCCPGGIRAGKARVAWECMYMRPATPHGMARMVARGARLWRLQPVLSEHMCISAFWIREDAVWVCFTDFHIIGVAKGIDISITLLVHSCEWLGICFIVCVTRRKPPTL
ncbi:hypothetical protein M3J09_007098 [Ascochyta lentis]